MSSGRARQQGFLVIAGVFLIVVLAGLIAYLTTVSSTNQAASAADLNSARALQAARAGSEWGTYELISSVAGANAFKTSCNGGSATSNRNFGSELAAFTVTVTCSHVTITEGPTSVSAYRLTSNACNEPVSGACPNTTTTSPTYVERELSLSLTGG